MRLIHSRFDTHCGLCRVALSRGTAVGYLPHAPRGKKTLCRACIEKSREQIKRNADAATRDITGADGDSRKTAIARFDSLDAWADACAGLSIERGAIDWAGGTMQDAIRMARTGDDSLVNEASALLDTIRVSMPDTIRTAYVPAPCGAYPIIPEVLSGFPLSMRVKKALHDDRAPVRIVVDLTVSGGIPHSDIRKRGIAALALAILVSESRPLELTTVTALSKGSKDGGLVTVTIPAQPLELATACHALTATSFFRRMGYDYLMEKFSCGGGWAWNESPLDNSGRIRYCARMRAALALASTDVLVPPVFLSDTIVRQPVQWINERLAEINGEDAAAV